jgi:hypothetical protein
MDRLHYSTISFFTIVIVIFVLKKTPKQGKTGQERKYCSLILSQIAKFKEAVNDRFQIYQN